MKEEHCHGKPARLAKLRAMPEYDEGHTEYATGLFNHPYGEDSEQSRAYLVGWNDAHAQAYDGTYYEHPTLTRETRP